VVRQRAVPGRAGVVLVYLKQSGEILERLHMVPSQSMSLASVAQGPDTLLVVAQGFRVGINGLLELTLAVARVAEIEPGLLILGIQTNYLLVVGGRFGVLAAPHQERSTQRPVLRILFLDLDRPSEVGEGLVEVFTRKK